MKDAPAWHDPSLVVCGSVDGPEASGSTVTTIVGNSYTIYYDKSANSNLAGKTYTLTGGGTLQPA